MSKVKKPDTYTLILDCAETLFARQGFNGTTTRQIAAQAGISIQTLHYHFGSKRRLYNFVIERAIAPVTSTVNKYANELLQRNLRDSNALEESVINIINELFEIFYYFPNYPLLFYREWIEHDQDLKSVKWERILPVVREWSNHIEVSADPELTRDMNLLLFFMSVGWMYWGLFVQPDFIGMLIEIDPSNPQFLSVIKEHAKEMTLRMLGQRKILMLGGKKRDE